MRQRATLLRDKEDVGQGGIAEGGPHSAIAAERDDGGGMQRDPPGFVKFRLADVQDRRGDIQVPVWHREADGFAYPEPCTGQQAEEGGKGRGTEGAAGTHGVGGADQGGDLLWCQEVGLRPTEGGYDPAGRD